MKVTAPKDLKGFKGNIITVGKTLRGNLVDYGGGAVAATQAWYQGNGGGFGSVSKLFR